MPDNVADQLADSANSYQINLLRVEAGMRTKIIAALTELEADIIGTLAKNPTLAPGKKKHLQSVLDATEKQVKGIYAQINEASAKDLEGVAKATNAHNVKAAEAAVGVDMGAMRLTPNQLKSIVRGPVLDGNPMEAWWNKQATDTTTRIHGEIQKGMLIGEDVTDLARRIRGTKATNYQDGILTMSKRQAEAIARTVVQSVANQAGIDGILNAGDAVKGIEWISTLDSRTTPVCRALDGLQWDLKFNPIGHDKTFPGPVAHWGCRSTQIAATRSWDELAGKKLPGDDETFKKNFEKRLAEKGFTPEQIAKAEANQRASMDGATSAGLDFDAWARKKGDAYIEKLIGPGRFALWKDNKLAFRDLVDQKGRPLTIEQLQAAIDAGNLPPETEGSPFVDFEPYVKPTVVQAEDPDAGKYVNVDSLPTTGVSDLEGGATILAYRTGDTSDPLGRGVYFAHDEDGANNYKSLHNDEDVQAWEIKPKKAIVGPNQHKILEHWGFGKDYYPGNYQQKTGKSGADIQRGIDKKFKTEALKRGYDAAILTAPLPPAKREIAIFKVKGTDLKKKSLKQPPAVESEAVILGKAKAKENAAATATIDDLLANPDGQKLKAKWAKKVQASDPDLSPTAQLAKIEASAAAEFAANKQSSLLSKAKKKLAEDLNLSAYDLPPSLKQAFEQLEGEPKAAWLASVKEARQAVKDAIQKKLTTSIVNQPTTPYDTIPALPPNLIADFEKLPAQEQAQISAILKQQQEKWDTATVAYIQGQIEDDYKSGDLQDSYDDSDLSDAGAKKIKATLIEYEDANTALELLNQAKAGTLTPEDALAQTFNLQGYIAATHAGDIKVLIAEAKAAAAALPKGPTAEEIKAASQKLSATVLDFGSEKTVNKTKAFKQITGIDPSGMTPLDLESAIKKAGIASEDIPELLAKTVLLGEEKQAAANLASKLSSAKKKLTDGKTPTPGEQAAILQLEQENASAHAQYLESVQDAIVAKAAGLTPAVKAKTATVSAQNATTKTATAPDLDASNLDLYVPDPSTLTKIGELSGSTKPILASDPATGKKWVVKSGGGGAEHLASEATADAIYRQMGASVPGSKFIDTGTGTYKVAEFIEGAETLGAWERGKTSAQKKAVHSQLQEHFVLDSLLGNWDVAGQSNDNIVVVGGKAVRIDNGGSLGFRAMGLKKTAAEWKPEVTELQTLRDPSKSAGSTATIFAGVTQDDINRQIGKILDNRESIIATAAKTEPASVVATLRKRIDWLASQLPDSQKPAAIEASRTANRNAADTFPDAHEIATRAKKARINGVAMSIGSADVEDLQSLVWQEADAAGKPVTVLTLKMTEAGANKFRASLPGSATANGSPATHPADHDYKNTILNMAKTLATHAKDGNYTQGTVSSFLSSKLELDSKLKVEKAKPKAAQDKALIDMLTDYGKHFTAVNKAYAAKTMPPQVPNDSWTYDVAKYQPGGAPAKAPTDFTATQGRPTITFRGTTMVNGYATEDAAQANQIRIEAPNWKIDFKDGATIDAIDRKPHAMHRDGLALEGTVTVRIPGEATAANVQAAVAKLEQLGLDTKPATADEREWLWLAKTANVHKDLNKFEWREISDEPDLPTRIKLARKQIETDYGHKPAERGEPGYTADGIPNSFGDGTRHVWRADLPPERAEKEMKGYTLRHTFNRPMVDAIEGFLSSGAELTPTADRIRKGVNIDSTAGWSPDADIPTGGASYFFTRIKKDTDKTPGLYFKIRNVGRADTISYYEDNFGSIDDLDERKATIPDLQSASGYGKNETIFKRGLFLLDELEKIHTSTDTEKKAVIAIFHKHGITHMTDGRPIEDVVK